MIANRQKSEVRSQDSELKTQKTIHHSLFTVFLLLFSVYCFLFVIGCGHTPPVLSDKHLQAVEFNQKAESAFKKGDYEKALNLYNEALRISRSIEDIDGIAINLINMAIVYHKLGDKESASRCVNEILDSSRITHNALRLSEAAFIKAMFYLEDSNYEYAPQWADKALSFCKSVQCSIEGRIYNLKSRITFLKGDFSSAVTYADRGLELNKKYEDREEIANSLRILAEIKSAKKEYNEARTLFENALIVDKTIGVNRKIAMDLMGIGDILFKQGMCENAMKYYKRALSVSEGAGDKEGIKEALRAIEKCLQSSEKR